MRFCALSMRMRNFTAFLQGCYLQSSARISQPAGVFMWRIEDLAAPDRSGSRKLLAHRLLRFPGHSFPVVGTSRVSV